MKNKLTTIFFEKLENFEWDFKNIPLISIYENIFKIYVDIDKDFENLLETYFHYWNGTSSMEQTEFYKEEWFYIFHKSIRQCDFFNHCYAIIPENLLNEHQTIRRNELLKLRSKVRKEKGLILETCSKEEHDEFNKQFDIDYVNELDQLLYLNKQFYNTTKENISGNLDMILWNLINFDTENVLKDILIKTFEQYKLINNW